ncbi:hypothetical protein GCM10007860_17480 [Chitiniphilus shinanonensis]|uniref:Amino acid transport protein n=1 Tax=Chitiniphilus shinanonensis TaxID=553088 RepID=A0ABQ6BVQ4_9NEIS|nr:hypothetical protein [Chitiniphilus shinanonensis]GLS04601.1 hypothetical protein GCM10007860_17480 [Chitiniphilus shinanonensis]
MTLPTPGSLFLGLMLNALGMAYFWFGRRQRRAMPLLSGLGLMVLPYLVSGLAWTLGLGALLAGLPFWVDF